MIRINEDYYKLKASYLFAEIARRINDFQETNPNKEIIRMGIGDVTLPLPAVCLDAFHKAVDEMGDSKTFRGYGPAQGYLFLREDIAKEDFKATGADIEPDEIFVSDGSKCDTGNIQEIFSKDIKVAIPDPVYPVYIDTNVMAGRTGEYKDGRYENIVYLECTKENGFIPSFPAEPVDLTYLCFPNNPTGAVITRDELKKWVDFAIENKALILFDAAYEAFVRGPNIPRSIYEIDGAKKVAIEFRSFSKKAGFTGTRCAYTVVPKECMGFDSKGEKKSLRDLWIRRSSTKFNGVSYPVQRAAQAVYTKEGKSQTAKLIDYYLKNAAVIKEEMTKIGFECTGGVDSPYIWIWCKKNSWDFFDILLKKACVVCTPGLGFGRCGEGFIRLSAFNSFENVKKAAVKIKEAL